MTYAYPRPVPQPNVTAISFTVPVSDVRVWLQQGYSCDVTQTGATRRVTREVRR